MFQDAGVASHSGHGGLVTGLRAGGVGQVSDAADAVPQGAPRVAARLMAADAVPKCAPHVAASVVACALLAGPQSMQWSALADSARLKPAALSPGPLSLGVLVMSPYVWAGRFRIWVELLVGGRFPVRIST